VTDPSDASSEGGHPVQAVSISPDMSFRGARVLIMSMTLMDRACNVKWLSADGFVGGTAHDPPSRDNLTPAAVPCREPAEVDTRREPAPITLTEYSPAICSRLTRVRSLGRDVEYPQTDMPGDGTL